MGHLIKKYLAFCLLLFLPLAGLFPSVLELYTGGDIGQAFTGGGRLKLSFGEVRFSLCDQDYNFGITATSRFVTKTFPVYFKAGNLSLSGIISRMNSPQLSASAMPFSASVSNVSVMTASLPAFTSFSKANSLFLQAGVYKKVFCSELSTWYSPEEEKLAFSSGGQLKLPGNNNLRFALAGGFFPHKEIGEAAWFLSKPYYPSGSHFCSALMLYASGLWGKTSFVAGLNENPFGKAAVWSRFDFRLNGEHFIWGSSAFYNNSPLNISSTEKLLDQIFQLKGNLQYKSILKTKSFPVFFKSGISSYWGLKLKENIHDCKLGLGLQFLFPLTLIQFSLVSDFDLSADFTQPLSDLSLSFKSSTLQIKNNWYFPLVNPGLSASFTAKNG
ncbi:MAG: hypothetical protein K5681_05460, partial [Treponema sp.]|nr:hypothetical protein [Treponema sp.]